MGEERYYWVKLDYRRFENGGDLDFLMSQKNGAEYVVLYELLCLNTRNTQGELISKLGEVIIPYDIDKIVRDCKYFSRDTVIIAMELYKKLGLIYEQEDGNLRISKHEEMVGSESKWAEYKRKQREIGNSAGQSVGQITGQCIGQCPTNVQQDIRDKRKDIRVKSKEKENIEESNSLRSLSSSSCPEPFCETSEPAPESVTSQPEEEEPVFISLETNIEGQLYPVKQSFVDLMKETYPAVDVEAELKKMRAWSITHPINRKTIRGMPRFINSWLAKEQDKGHYQPQAQRPQPQRYNLTSTNAELDASFERLKKDPRYKGVDITDLI